MIDEYVASKGQSGIAGYPLALVVDGAYVCPNCAERDSFTERQLSYASVGVYAEGADLRCDCGDILESAYGDLDNWIPDD